jgi:hypothetical protein
MKWKVNVKTDLADGCKNIDRMDSGEGRADRGFLHIPPVFDHKLLHD